MSLILDVQEQVELFKKMEQHKKNKYHTFDLIASSRPSAFPSIKTIQDETIIGRSVSFDHWSTIENNKLYK